MNRSAVGYVLELIGVDIPPQVVKGKVAQSPQGLQAYLDDGSGGHYYPPSPTWNGSEEALELVIDYPPGVTGCQGERGIRLVPLTLDGWNAIPGSVQMTSYDEMMRCLAQW